MGDTSEMHGYKIVKDVSTGCVKVYYYGNEMTEDEFEATKDKKPYEISEISSSPRKGRASRLRSPNIFDVVTYNDEKEKAEGPSRFVTNDGVTTKIFDHNEYPQSSLSTESGNILHVTKNINTRRR